jgi:hypothetical protein
MRTREEIEKSLMQAYDVHAKLHGQPMTDFNKILVELLLDIRDATVLIADKTGPKKICPPTKDCEVLFENSPKPSNQPQKKTAASGPLGPKSK